MGNADFDRIKARVTEILNASAAGTFSSTLSARNKTRNADAIEAACFEAGLKVIQFIASFPNEFRNEFVEPTTLNHGDELPAHLGKPTYVEIQKYSGAGWTAGNQKDYHKVDSYRTNRLKTYDDKDHNVQDSTLAGYYDISEDKIYFTGYACRVGLAAAERDDVLTKIPDFFENTVIKLAVGNCLKAGEGAILLNIAQGYNAAAENDLMMFKGGARSLPPVPEAEAMPNPQS